MARPRFAVGAVSELQAKVPGQPQDVPAPLTTPLELTCKHWLEPVTLERVKPAAVAAPEEFTWNGEPEPTESNADGEVVPMPTLPDSWKDTIGLFRTLVPKFELYKSNCP
jgi:hypothetical protein